MFTARSDAIGINLVVKQRNHVAADIRVTTTTAPQETARHQRKFDMTNEIKARSPAEGPARRSQDPNSGDQE